MAAPNKSRLRWSTALTEALGCCALLAQAAMADAAPAPDPAPAPLLLAAAIVGDDTVNRRAPDPTGNDLYLELRLNGRPVGLAQFAWRDKELWANTRLLRELGFVLPADTPDPVRLRELPGLSARYDSANQVLALDAAPELLRLPPTVLEAPTMPSRRANAAPGLLLNYDLYGTQGQGGATGLHAYAELRAFSGQWVFSNTGLAQAVRADASGWQGRSARLDSTWSLSFPDSMTTLRLGDTLTGALPWSRATRIGGVQIARNFALQPYRATTPLPAFLGTAAMPSDVEVYINGMRQYRGQVAAGPFVLNTIPGISGAGNAQVVLTDAFGRATTLNFSLYEAQQLLQKGLSDWSADIGVVRRNYGLASFDYGSTPAASGSWRHGLSDTLTVDAHAEASGSLALAGGGAAWLLGGAGVVSGALARSQQGGAGGTLWSLGYDWRGSRLNFSLAGGGTQGDYRDVASLHGGAVPAGSGRALVGYSTGRFGSVGLSYLYLRYPAQAAARYANAYWFLPVGRSASLNVSLNQSLDRPRDLSVFAGFTWALDERTTVAAGVQRDRDRNVYAANAQSPTPGEGGFGWRAGLSQGPQRNGALAQIDYLGRYGSLNAGVNDFPGSRYAYAGASGAAVLMGGHVFAARRIDDAFAIVSTDGIAGVPVKLENRVIGSTDANGMLLATPLNAYQNNQLSIDPMQLPADMRIESVKAVATPSDRAGTLVRFGIRPVRAATIVLIDAQGNPLALGSRVRLAGAPEAPAIVGYDGQVYLDTLQARNHLEVQTADGRCEVRFDYPAGARGVPQIGPLACMKRSS